MGQITIPIKVQNWLDIERVALGERTQPPRAVEAQALVDAGAVKLYLKESIIRQLGLRPLGEVASRTMANLSVKRRVFSPVDLEIQGRSGRFDVIEVTDMLPNVIGQIPLEDLDWVVDPRNRRLMPNPEHKNGEMYDDF